MIGLVEYTIVEYTVICGNIRVPRVWGIDMLRLKSEDLAGGGGE